MDWTYRTEDWWTKRPNSKASKEERLEKSKHYLSDISIMSGSLIRLFIYISTDFYLLASSLVKPLSMSTDFLIFLLICQFLLHMS